MKTRFFPARALLYACGMRVENPVEKTSVFRFFRFFLVLNFHTEGINKENSENLPLLYSRSSSL